MNERIRQLLEQAGVTYAVMPKDTVYEKFAELIVQECAACCGSQADMRNIRKRFGLSVESNVKYLGPEKSGSVNSQYEREYNLPGEGNK